MIATPHRCAIHPCRADADAGHSTCVEHREQEAELVARYIVHRDREIAENEQRVAEQRAREEIAASNPEVQRRAQEILETMRARPGGRTP